MKELEHKREIEGLWQEKLAVYQAQRELEIEEKRRQEQESQRKLMVIQMEKERLLREHGIVLRQYHPKAAANYGGFK